MQPFNFHRDGTITSARRSDPPLLHLIDESDEGRSFIQSLLPPDRYDVRPWTSARLFLDLVETVPQGCVIVGAVAEGLSVYELQRVLAASDSGMPILILADEYDVEAAVTAMRLGAVDVILKPVNSLRLRDALVAAEIRLEKSQRRAATLKRVQAVLNLLTKREKEVLAGLTRGLSNKEIGKTLLISGRTVDIHRANIMQKLDAESLSQALRIAFIAEVCGQYNPTLHVQ